jgi:hypothetical protein
MSERQQMSAEKAAEFERQSVEALKTLGLVGLVGIGFGADDRLRMIGVINGRIAEPNLAMFNGLVEALSEFLREQTGSDPVEAHARTEEIAEPTAQ